MNGIKDIKTPIIKTLLLNDKFEESARIVKARIEITWLGEISKYIKEVYTPQGCYLRIKIDADTLNLLKIELDMDQIKSSIISSKLGVWGEDIEIDRGQNVIWIRPNTNLTKAKNEIYFAL